jgi:hypothetical protein
MALKSTTALTLADWGKRKDPDGKIAVITELLSQTNPILQDMPFVEGNLPTGHRTTVRSGLPSATWRLLNYGVQPSKSTTVQITDACGMLETYSERQPFAVYGPFISLLEPHCWQCTEHH